MSRPPAAARPRLGFVLPVVGVTAGFTLVVFGSGSWAGTYYSNLRIYAVVAALVGLLAWLLMALRRPELRPASGLMGALAAALAAFGIAELQAWNPRLGLDFLGYAVLLTALYLLLVRLWAAPVGWATLAVLAAVTCAVGGLAHIWATVSAWMALWSRLGQVVVPPLRFGYEGLWLGSPNAFAAFQVLLLATAAPTLWPRGRRGRASAVLLAILVGVNVALSASRGAWLGLALAMPVTLGAWLLTTPGRTTARRVVAAGGRRLVTAGGRWLVVGAGALVVAAAGLAAAVGPALLARVMDLSGAGVRTSFLSASWRMFQSAPLTGLGPGSWVPARLSFTDATELDYYIPHAHNVPAQVLAEFGLVGVVAAVIVVLSVLRLVLRGTVDAAPAARLPALAALFACTYLAGQQLVDAFIHQPAILVALALPVARLDAMITATPAASSTRPALLGGRLLAVVLIPAVAVAAAISLWPEGAARMQEQAVAAANAGDWRAAETLAAQAVTVDPNLAPYQFLKGLAAAEAGDLQGAREALAAAARLDDYPAAWLDLAAVQVRLGDPKGERASLDRAVRLGWQQPTIAVPAADMYRQLRDPAAAQDLIAAAIATAPSLASDPLWQTPDWASIAAAAIDDVLVDPDSWTAFQVALEAGRADQARMIADDLDADRHDLGELTLAAWTGDQSAFEQLHALAKASPLDETTVGLCRRVARLHDPDGTAPGWTCDGNWWFGVYPITRVGAGLDEGVIAGPAAYPHALYAYRRPGPVELLVSWLLHLNSIIA